ncbi:hypothetical protein [Deinococcus aquaticus]|uniref:hypothetical protein n=1 Tax=Deinococcus aquaticus TaxID=328692 RepID=UPI003607D9CD
MAAVALRGVQAGQEVITPVPASLQDGAKVKVKRVAADAASTGATGADAEGGTQP